MPRPPRILGNSGYMHIISRGVNRENIFYDDSDYSMYLKILNKLKEDLGFTIIAYCLMSNHTHVIIRDTEKRFSEIVRKLTGTYAYYFNGKYDHAGHVFQNRFLGRPIETDQYLMICIRYIHNNPPKAGICPAASYRWSSYPEYLAAYRKADRGQALSRLCDTSYILNHISTEKDFISFHSRVNVPTEFELEHFEERRAPDDGKVRDLVCFLLNDTDLSRIHEKGKEDR